MRLLPGWLAFQQGRAFTLDGDESIRRRPVDRIAEPLALMGARIEAREGRYPPFTVHGSALRGIEYELPVASAQVKSCVLLAGLAHRRHHRDRAGTEPRSHRAHAAAAPALRSARGRSEARLYAPRSATPTSSSSSAIAIPGDMSLGGVPDRRRACSCRARGWCSRTSASTGRGTGSCGSSSGWGRSCSATREPGGAFARAEPVCGHRRLRRPDRGDDGGPHEVPLAIDELPLVALLGCFAEGETVVRGAGELRLKESDRIATVVEGLRGLGAEIEASPDGFAVQGTGGLRGGRLEAHGDHRLALLGAVAGLASRGGRRGGRDGGRRRSPIRASPRISRRFSG